MKKNVWRICAAAAVSMTMLFGCGEKTDRYEYRKLGIEAIGSGDFAGALKNLELALNSSEGTVGRFEIDVLKYRGEAEYQLGDYAAAAHTYDVLIQVDEERAEYLYLRCLSNAALGNLEPALADYTKASAADKDAAGSDAAFFVLTTMLEEQGQYEKAMTLYKQAVTDGKQNSELYNRMGLCMLRAEEYQEALGYFSLGIQAKDELAMPKLMYNQAVTYEYMGDFSQALTAMEAYNSRFGPDDNANREIAFLKTR